MYRTISDFTTDWAHEQESTLKNLANLTDASLSQLVAPGGRTLGFLAWHITVSLGMAAEAGLPLEIVPGDAEVPSSAEEIRKAYEKLSSAMVAGIKKSWTDASLLEEVQMYGMTWTRGYALLAMVKHQAHHRGQMTVLMRQAGLKVHGVYGPAKEEWASMGMEALP